MSVLSVFLSLFLSFFVSFFLYFFLYFLFQFCTKICSFLLPLFVLTCFGWRGPTLGVSIDLRGDCANN